MGISAQIRAAHGRVVLQLRGRAVADDASILQEIATAGDGEPLPGVLLHQQHADAQLLDARQRLEQLLAHERREAQRRLIQQQDVGVRHQRAADGNHLPLATAHGAGELAQALGETRKQGEHALQVLRFPRMGPRRESAEPQIFAHREIGEDAAVFRHEREPGLDHLVRLQGGDVGTAEFNSCTGPMADHAAQRFQA